MVIGRPHIIDDGAEHVVSADILFQSSHPSTKQLPQTLWYRVKKEHCNMLTDDANAFLVPLVGVAMFLGEDIEVEGSVSAQLAYSLREYQRILNFWHPEWFRIVQIRYKELKSVSEHSRPRGVMCPYTGGIDSTHTLFSHLPQNEPFPDMQVTHALFVRDSITRDNEEYTQVVKEAAFSAMLKRNAVELIVPKTNSIDFHTIMSDLPMGFLFSARFVGAALLFAHGINRFHFSADNTHDYSPVSTINHFVCPLFSTEDVRVDVFGASQSKFEKVRAFSGWEESHQHLVCCWEQQNGLRNCGTCMKCCLTVALLAMEDVLHLYKNFPSQVNHAAIRSRNFPKDYEYFYVAWGREAWKRKQWHLYLDFRYGFYRNRVRRFLLTTAYGFILSIKKQLYRFSGLIKQHSRTYVYLVDKLKGV